MTIAFDTLSFAKRLESAGFTRQQAEVLADEQAKLIDERLATKGDIRDVNTNIELIRRDIIIKIGGMLIVAVGILIAALGDFFKH